MIEGCQPLRLALPLIHRLPDGGKVTVSYHSTRESYVEEGEAIDLYRGWAFQSSLLRGGDSYAIRNHGKGVPLGHALLAMQEVA